MALNVLIVSQPARDGVLRHVIGLADYLHAQGDRVHLAYSDKDASDQLFELLDHIRQRGGSAVNLAVRNAPQPADLPALWKLWQLARHEKPDIVHAHSSKAGALARGLALLGLLRQPVFYSPNSYYRMDDPGNPKARLFHAIERVLRHGGTTIALSRCESEFAQHVIGVPPSEMLVCGNGVDFARFHSPTPEEKLAARRALGLPETGRLLGSCGRFSLQKDPVSMYAAFAEVAAAVSDVTLVHLGQGELEPEVDQLIAERGIASRCRRIPYLKDSAPYYRALDGFILASLYEGMSYAVLEAFATDLPMVLSRAPGNVDFAEFDFSHIEWCEPGNRESIARAITAWRARFDEPDAPNHREVALRHFSLDACYAPVRRAYEAAVGRLSGAP